MNDSAPESASTRQRAGRMFVLVPAATFLVGLLLGAVLVWVADPGGTSVGDDGEAASPTPTPATNAPASPAETPESIIVPSACVQAAQAAGDVVRLVRDAATALGDLDTVRLQQILDRLERLDGQIRQDASQCRPESSPEAPASPESPGAPGSPASPGPTSPSPGS